MQKRFLLLALGSSIFLIFIFFSYLVHKDVFTQFDFDTTVRLQDNISRRFDYPFSLFSDIGTFEIMLGVLIVLLILRRKILGIIAFGFFGLFHVIELYGKSFVDHLPPPEFLLRTKHWMEFPQFHVRQEFSYPSGHAGRAAFLTIILGSIVLFSNKFSKTQKILIISILASYDVIMLISRIYLGEHWATDVIGGALLGIALALISAAAIL